MILPRSGIIMSRWTWILTLQLHISIWCLQSSCIFFFFDWFFIVRKCKSMEMFEFSKFYTKFQQILFQIILIFCSRRERSLAPSVGISAMNLMTVTGNVLYWTSTFTAKKERFPGMRSFTLPVSVSLCPRHAAVYQEGAGFTQLVTQRWCPPSVNGTDGSLRCSFCIVEFECLATNARFHFTHWSLKEALVMWELWVF